PVVRSTARRESDRGCSARRRAGRGRGRLRDPRAARRARGDLRVCVARAPRARLRQVRQCAGCDRRNAARPERARRAAQSRHRAGPDRRRPGPRERAPRTSRARRASQGRHSHHPHRGVLRRPAQAELGPECGQVKLRRKLLPLILALLPAIAAAAPAIPGMPGIPAFSVQTAAGGGQTYTLTLQVLALMTAITLLPAILLMMTAFTRIVIVLSILRQALGAGQTPPNQVLLGLALFLTFFVMSPVITRIDQVAYQPYAAGTIDAPAAFSRAEVPLKEFMLHQTRENDIATFVHIAGGRGYQTPLDVPLSVLVPAFVTSELKTSFI